MSRLSVLLVSAALTLVAAQANAADSLTITFTPLVDTTTVIPAGTGSFTAFVSDSFFPTDPCISFGNVAFFGAGAGGQQGLYLLTPPDPIYPPNPIRIADLNTAIPAGTGNFTGFLGGPFLSGLNVAFLGAGTGGQQGVYVLTPPDPIIPPDPIRVADLNTAIPAGTGNFTSFSPFLSIDGSDVALVGSGSAGQSGVYALLGGTLSTIADTATPIPGGSGNFKLYPGDPCRILDQTVSFIGEDALGQPGVYVKAPGDPCKAVADTSTPIPELGSSFAFFNSVSYDGAFLAFNGGLQLDNPVVGGVYKSQLDSGAITKVADTGTAVPGGIGSFLGFGNVVVDPGVVVFEGASDNGAGGSRLGLYTDLGGALAKIVAEGDTLAGKMVAQLHFGPNGFSEGRVVFSATFTDGSQGITLASLCAGGIAFEGFAAPIGGADATGGTSTDPIQAFKLKSTIPVKMILTNCDGSPVTTGNHTIQLVKFTSATDSDAPINATPTDAATIGNAFRLADAATGEWHFNLDTKAWGITTGTWQIRVTLADGNLHTAFISVK